MLSRRHLAIVGAIVTLGMPGEGRAQVDTQVWANLKLDWIRSHHVTIVVDAEPKVLVSAPDGDPGWATIDVTPSIEYARGEWFDIVGETLVGWTQQTDDLNSTELTPRLCLVGLRRSSGPLRMGSLGLGSRWIVGDRGSGSRA